MLVGVDEQCKVTDFGLARDVQEEGFYEKKTKVSVKKSLKRKFIQYWLHDRKCENVSLSFVTTP